VSTRSKSFWSTMPGLITGLAGILTALVGLGTLLIQIGVIGGDGDDSNPTKTTPGQTATTRAGASPADDSDGSGTATGPPRFTVAPDEVKLTAGEKTENVTVANTGQTAFTLSTELTGSGEDQFTVSKGTCGSQVPKGGSCVITVTFKGALAAKADLVVTAPGGSSQEVKLEGSLL
jgi:hypothetical protein